MVSSRQPTTEVECAHGIDPTADSLTCDTACRTIGHNPGLNHCDHRIGAGKLVAVVNSASQAVAPGTAMREVANHGRIVDVENCRNVVKRLTIKDSPAKGIATVSRPSSVVQNARLADIHLAEGVEQCTPRGRSILTACSPTQDAIS